MDRYNHDMGGDDTDDTDDFPLIGSFGSYSPQYRKHNSSLVQINLPSQSLDDSVNTSGGSGTASPIFSNLSQSINVPPNTVAPTIGKIMSTPQLRKLDVSTFYRYTLHQTLKISSFDYRFVVRMP